VRYGCVALRPFALEEAQLGAEDIMKLSQTGQRDPSRSKSHIFTLKGQMVQKRVAIGRHFVQYGID
jgi:hypothetical protein